MMPRVDAFEHDKDAVLDDLRQGRFDYLEVASRATEARFFRHLLEQGDLRELARTYPTPRRKEEVPLWLYLASQLTLRLHGQHAYATLPYVLHCGGLRDALGPSQARITEPEEGVRRLRCEGYNEKNVYERTTPCDQDFVRKLAKDTAPSALVAWYGEHVARYLHGAGAFDDEGVFLLDGSYLFVPDNENYEGSSKLRFDGSHPISKAAYEALPPEKQERTGWHRCYRSVFLLHLGRNAYPFAGLAVMAGKESELPQLRTLVDRFVGAVGEGVMKLLIFDRGFIDGPTISHLKQDHGIDSLFPLKKGMLDLADARVLAEADGEPWETWRPPPAPKPVDPPQRPEWVRQRERARQQSLEELKAKQKQEQPPAPVLEKVELKAIHDMKLWGTLTVAIQVVLMREHWSDGEIREWNLATTNPDLKPLEVRAQYARRTAVEERHRQLKCFWDLADFRSRAFSLVTAQVTFVLLAYSLLQMFLAKLDRGDLNERTRSRLMGELALGDDMVVLYSNNRVAYLTPLEHQEALLTLPEDARRRVLAKTRKLRERMLPGVDLPRRPDA
jgi:hypothetical protein